MVECGSSGGWCGRASCWPCCLPRITSGVDLFWSGAMSALLVIVWELGSLRRGAPELSVGFADDGEVASFDWACVGGRIWPSL